MEQYQGSNNLEIKGVPGEGDPYDIVKRIATVLEETVSDADIDVCQRLSTFKPNEKNIIVRFVQRMIKNKFLEKAKKMRLTTRNLDYSGPSSPVYVNEHLTSISKKLLGAAIAQKRRMGWKFVWSSGGMVFSRKDENADVLRITSLTDVDKIAN